MAKSPSYTAQSNLKGKKTKLLACRCCEIINFKEKILKKIHNKEMKELDFSA